MESQRERLKREARSKIDLTYYEFFLERDIESLKSFIENGEQWIVLEEKKLHKKLAKWKKERLKHEDAPEPYDVYEKEILNLGRLQAILYNSSLSLAFGIFENNFRKLCIEWKNYKKLKINVKDIKGEGEIGQCKNYIEKVIGISLIDLNDAWKEINFYRVVRNSIIHSDGNVEDRKINLIKEIPKKSGISYDIKSNSIIINSKDFIFNFISIAEKYILNVIDKLTKIEFN